MPSGACLEANAIMKYQEASVGVTLDVLVNSVKQVIVIIAIARFHNIISKFPFLR